MNLTERAAVQWLFGGDTGSSSETLCQYLLFGTVGSYVATPSDAADFGRCYRLLARVPGWRKRIGELAGVTAWRKLARSWDELEALYEAALAANKARDLALEREHCKDLYDLLHNLTRVPPRKRRSPPSSPSASKKDA